MPTLPFAAACDIPICVVAVYQTQTHHSGGRFVSHSIHANIDFAANMLRLGWYTGVGVLADRIADRAGHMPATRRPERVVPDQKAVVSDMIELFRRDADLVRRGAAAVAVETASEILDHFSRLRAMLADIPQAVARQKDRKVDTVDAHGSAGLPKYYTQDFHFQTGGYLSDDSALLYDVQVETLFRGAASAMRRQALAPIADYMRGRDQRSVSLLDVACGTGRFLREVRMAYPAMTLAGVDLSQAYLKEAERHFDRLRPVCWLNGNAEAIPLADASQDIVTVIYLFHELPPDVRIKVIAEMTRVLKPGGLLVFIDSLQKGDRPGGWDGFLEGFPERFHEPYFRHYTIDDLDAAFNSAGLPALATWPAFLSKIMVRSKPAARRDTLAG
jgi:ubiquinone/menaquinone biosynthesis C-methylase UbiE